MRHFKTISEFHRFRNLPGPHHPLISLIHVADAMPLQPDEPTNLVEYGQTGRVRLTTLTKEFFMPRFLERDECEREAPCDKYPWDGISGTRPFHEYAKTTTVGVY